MELHDAIDAYRERITYVLSQHPTATDEWVRETTDGLMQLFEHGKSNGNGSSRSSPVKERAS